MVMMEYSVWEEILAMLEDRKATKEPNQVKLRDGEITSWKQAKAKLRAKGVIE